MASRARRVTSRLLVAGFLITIGQNNALAQEEHDDEIAAMPVVTRVRTGDARLAGLIRHANDGSRTFRQMIGAIEATDGLVYVDRGRCFHGIKACLTWITVSRGNRMLHVIIDERLSDTATMAAIGHELRHALELLGDVRVTSRGAMYSFYQREGFVRNSTFETHAAVAAGEAVLRELKR
jgi:hypothetical protein